MKARKIIITCIITAVVSLFSISCISVTITSPQNITDEPQSVIQDAKQTTISGAEEVKYDIAEVTKHVDGDTFYVNINKKEYKVRLIGVDCPESTNKTEPFGKESSDYTKEQLLGKSVYLERDVGEIDRYGRLLRYVWLVEPRNLENGDINAKMYNAVLVADGYAQVMTVPPNVKYQERFITLQRDAMKTRKGLWALNKLESKNSQFDEFNYSYIGNSNSAKFHKVSCRYVEDIKEEYKVYLVTREDAIDSEYEPCKVCNP